MTRSLGGPREGSCRVTKMTGWVGSDGELRVDFREDLGVMAWTGLIALAEQQGGSRPTYDLFDVPGHDGTVVRYRAVNCAVIL